LNNNGSVIAWGYNGYGQTNVPAGLTNVVAVSAGYSHSLAVSRICAPGSATNLPVLTQPPLSRTLGAGASTLMSFGLTGYGPFTYQWRLNNSPLSGATNPSVRCGG
jgi:hypothetical protein